MTPFFTPVFGFVEIDNMIRLVEYGEGEVVKRRPSARFGQGAVGGAPQPEVTERPMQRMTKAEVLHMCLIKPVSDAVATVPITAEELEAQATWGIRAVKATGTNLTGAGVTVSIQRHLCRGCRQFGTCRISDFSLKVVRRNLAWTATG